MALLLALVASLWALTACAPDDRVPADRAPGANAPEEEASTVDAGGLAGEYLGQEPPGRSPEVFAPGIVSRGFHEHHLAISPSGDEMFYATSSNDHQVYVIARMWRSGGVWHGPSIAPFSGQYMDMGPSFSPDGRALYFTSRRPLAVGMQENDTFDIWRVEKIGNVRITGAAGEAGHGWSQPMNLGAPVNTAANEIFPSVASDGTLYFQQYEESGSESDFYMSDLVDGEYRAPVMLEYGISTEHYESHPAVAPDESHLIFQSIRPDGFGGVDFYVSFRENDGTWTEPANLGLAVSATDNVISPMLSPDGRYFFFARNGPSGPLAFRGDSFADLLGQLRAPENGYGCLYWVDAEIVYELHPRLRR